MNDIVHTTSDSPAVLQDDHTSERGVVVDLQMRSSSLVRGLDLVLMHHGASQIIRDDLSLQVHMYLDICPNETVWLKHAKWMLAYPLSRYLRNELPPLPDRAFVPTGLLRSWMRQRLTSFCRRNTHLWYSWLQAKRCALPASDTIVEQTYHDHYISLTKEDPGDQATIDEIFADRTFISLLDKLRDDITEKFSSAPLFEEYAASSSACFEQTRSAGGQHGELRTLAGFSSLYGTELTRMSWVPVLHGSSRSSNVTIEYRRAEGESLWTTLREKAESFQTAKPIKCTIQAILEPMKVRVISKGEALPYYTMKPLQKIIHGSMRNMDCFRLIGRPLSPTDIIDLKANAATPWKWFSIDYSAATDGLSWRYSGRILSYLLSSLPERQRNLAMSVLGPHALHYPNGSKKEFRGVQRNGQLMGSILSFPILCLANVGVYLNVMSQIQQGWSNRDRLRHVLVNGDDMVYAGPESLWKTHADVSAKVGLKMSVGKAYIHEEYLNINSTSVSCRISNDSTPWVIPYLNAGLFYGQHKVQGEHVPSDGDHHAYTGGLVANLNVVLNGSLPGRQADLLKYFLHVHREEVQTECRILVRDDDHKHRKFYATRNLFLPIQMGGMGVEAPSSFAFRITPFDKKLARSCVERCSAFRSYSLPAPGHIVSWIEREVKAPWSKPMADDKDLLTNFKSVNYENFLVKSSTFQENYLRISSRKLNVWQVLRPCHFWWPSQAYAA